MSLLEDRVVETTQAEQEKKKGIKKYEDSLWDLWDKVKILAFTL